MQEYPRGVSQTPSGRFVARIGVGGRRLHLGTFGSPEEAIATLSMAKGEKLKEPPLIRRRCNNTSGKSGVSFDSARGKYRAYIGKDRERHFLGDFETFEDARAARIAAEFHYFQRRVAE